MSKPLAAAGRKVLLALAVLAATGAVQPPAVAADDAAAPLSAPPGAAAETALVTLVTGDQVSVISQGGHTGYALAPHSAASAVQFLRDPTGDEYAIPAAAAPYLGRGLDRSLFDVSALAGNGASAKIPVDLSFAAGATPTAPPGVTLTSTSGRTAAGYLTPASAAAFGAALRHQIGADVAAGRRPGSSALAPGLVGLSLTGASSGQTVTPFYPMHLLQVNAIDATGAPAANPFVLLVNTDSVSRQNNLVPVADGVGRIQVPAGHYAAINYYSDFDAGGNVTAIRQVVVSDFTVPSSGTVPTLTVDFRTATSPVTAHTPRPSVMEAVQVTTAITDSSGGVAAGSAAAVGIPMYVNAAPAPTTGAMHYVVQWDGAAAKAGDHYRYDVAFPSDNGIPADEAYTVRSDQLATVRQSLSADPAAGQAGSSPGGPKPGQAAAFYDGAIDPTLLAANATFAVAATPQMPEVLTQYLGTADGGAWTQADSTPSGVGLYSSERVFAARRDYRIDWAHGPLAPNWGQYTGPGQQCAACTSGTNLWLRYNLIADSEPDHQTAQLPLPTALHLTVYRDNTTIFDQDWYYGVGLTAIPLTPSTYRAVLDMNMSAVAGFSQSTVTHTDLTFKYDPTADPRSALPGSDYCFQPSATTPCQILPVLTLHYGLATDLTDTSTGPVQTLALTVGHLSYDGFGSHSPITSAGVSVSFDDGKTWQPTHVLGHAGHYLAVWPNHAAKGATAMLRVTATDAGGNAISQTITNAYTVGGNK